MAVCGRLSNAVAGRASKRCDWPDARRLAAAAAVGTFPSCRWARFRKRLRPGSSPSFMFVSLYFWTSAVAFPALAAGEPGPTTRKDWTLPGVGGEGRRSATLRISAFPAGDPGSFRGSTLQVCWSGRGRPLVSRRAPPFAQWYAGLSDASLQGRRSLAGFSGIRVSLSHGLATLDGSEKCPLDRAGGGALCAGYVPTGRCWERCRQSPGVGLVKVRHDGHGRQSLRARYIVRCMGAWFLYEVDGLLEAGKVMITGPRCTTSILQRRLSLQQPWGTGHAPILVARRFQVALHAGS